MARLDPKQSNCSGHFTLRLTVHGSEICCKRPAHRDLTLNPKQAAIAEVQIVGLNQMHKDRQAELRWEYIASAVHRKLLKFSISERCFTKRESLAWGLQGRKQQ